MYRLLFVLLFAVSFATAQTGQNKKPVPKNTKAVAKDTSGTEASALDTAAIRREEAAAIPREFAVYTKRSKLKNEKMKLCINLVSPDNIFNYCLTDSICRDPEVTKILFEKRQGDTTYVLIYVRAFSKPADKPSCDAGKEVKLYFVRWDTKSNKAIVKIKNVESCMKGITNMTKESVDSWDNTSPLVFKYYRTGDKFYEVTFDPNHYLLGFQSVSE